MEVSYIIPAFNAGIDLKNCVGSILQQSGRTSDFEILVVDNNSTDGSLNDVESMPRVSILKEPRQGAASARNLGLSKAKGQFIAFIDSDVELDPDWTQACLEAFKNPFIDCVQSAVIPESRRRGLMRKLRSAFIAMKTQDSFNYLTAAKAQLPVVNSAAFVVRSEFLNSRGIRFETNLQRCEDIDLSMQLLFKGCGFAAVSDTSAKVYDSRNWFSYLKRCYVTGIYSAEVRKLWGSTEPVPIAYRFKGLLNRFHNPIALTFILSNQIATILGERLVRPQANELDSKIDRTLEGNPRNAILSQVFSGADTNRSIPGFVRMIDLGDEIILIDLISNRRLQMSGGAQNRLRRILNGTAVFKTASHLHIEQQIDRLKIQDASEADSFMEIDGIAQSVFLSLNGERTLNEIIDQMVHSQEVDQEDRKAFEADTKCFALALSHANVVTEATE